MNEIETLMGTETADKPEDDLKERALEYIKRYKQDLDLLAIDREHMMDSYMCRPFGNEVAGRSAVVMSDTQDTIEWIMPSLMRIFFGGRDVVRIEGQGPEDTQGAKLLNEKVNHDFTRGMQGYLLMHDWFKDALLQRLGVVKWWWETGEDARPKEFKALNQEEYDKLKSTENFMVDEETENPGLPMPMGTDPMTGMPMTPPSTYDVKGRAVRKYSKPMAAALPPEEFICNVRSADFSQDDFVAHRKKLHKTELKMEYGIEEEDLIEEARVFSEDLDFMTRFKDLGGIGFVRDVEDKDYYYIYECCINDYSSGKKDPIILTILGTRELRRQPNKYGRPNYCSLSPIRMAHRAIGRCLADLTMDLQKLKSAIARFCLDNLYFQNNGMAIVNPWKLNITDLLNPAPGKLVRMKEDEPVQNAYFPIPVTPFASHAFAMLDRADEWEMKRTGVTSYNQGLDANSLNKTATGISQIMSAAQARIEHIARTFAETGVKELFEAFAQMNVDYLKEDISIPSRLNEEWLTIDPSSIDVYYDAVIDVGLGTGSREQMIQSLFQMLDRSMNPLVIQGGVFTLTNLYNVMSTLYELMGFKNSNQYATKPQEMPNVAGNVGPGQGVPGLAPPGVIQNPGALGGGQPAPPVPAIA